MKKYLVILFLTLLSVDAFSAHCSNLFSISNSTINPEKRIDEAIVAYRYVINPMQITLSSLREGYRYSDPNSQQGMLFAEKIKTIENQIRERSTQITSTISELLTAKNIKHTIITRQMDQYGVDYFILFSTEGNHYINAFAKRVHDKYKLELSIDLPTLVQNKSNALYSILKDGNPKIILSPSIISNSSVYQDNVALHEFTHHINFNQIRENIQMPYHAKIETKVMPPNLMKKLGVYNHEFSVDEIKAFRSTIRALAHDAITDKGTVDKTHYYFQKIITAIQLEITFSQIVNNIFIKYKEMENRKLTFIDKLLKRTRTSSKNIETIKLYISPSEEYYVTARPSMIASTIEMSAFTLNLYTMIYNKLIEAKNKSHDEKLKLLRQIVKILSIPEIRRLNGNYPSSDEINSYFD